MLKPMGKQRQRDGKRGGGWAQFVDLHSHLIPGVDDGARDGDESRAALKAMRSVGVSAIVTTPHVKGSLALQEERMHARLRALDDGWAELIRVRDETVPELELRRGAEVLLDVPEPELGDPRLRLGGGRFVLVEFAYFTVPPRSARVIVAIRAQGWIPIVAHPERYRNIESDLDVIEEWRGAGAHLQVNGPSLIGRYGAAAKDVAVRLLERGWADYLSSDYHARGETGIIDYREVLGGMAADAQAELLMCTNPARLLNDELPLPVPPLATRRRLWDRIAAAFR